MKKNKVKNIKNTRKCAKGIQQKGVCVAVEQLPPLSMEAYAFTEQQVKIKQQNMQEIMEIAERLIALEVGVVATTKRTHHFEKLVRQFRGVR